MLCHLYNPENDLALASGLTRYTAPAAAAAVHRAGALLPLWWAGPEDYVVAAPEDAPLAAMLAERYGLHGTLTAPVACGPLPEGTAGAPWGWSADAAAQLARAGVPCEGLPSAPALERLRQLSHRRLGLRLLQRLGVEPLQLPVEACSVHEALDAIRSFGGDAYVKLPWSGSGRGVMHTADMPPAELERHIAGFIRRQGGVMVERTLDMRRGFAMLFYADASGRVTMRGVSCFLSSASGVYAGNIMASQPVLESIIGADHNELHTLGLLVAAVLQELLEGSYSGWLGVDMAVTGDNCAIWPCIEINLRRTMGVAAMMIASRLPGSMQPGVLTFTHKPHRDDLVVSGSLRGDGPAFVVRSSETL